jgi:hypothetical protein
MQDPNPHDYYLGKTADHSLAQNVKESYDDVEKGARGYKVASIESGTVHLACQLIVGKCVEGLQMNWVTHLVNQLEIDCR